MESRIEEQSLLTAGMGCRRLYSSQTRWWQRQPSRSWRGTQSTMAASTEYAAELPTQACLYPACAACLQADPRKWPASPDGVWLLHQISQANSCADRTSCHLRATHTQAMAAMTWLEVEPRRVRQSAGTSCGSNACSITIPAGFCAFLVSAHSLSRQPVWNRTLPLKLAMPSCNINRIVVPEAVEVTPSQPRSAASRPGSGYALHSRLSRLALSMHLKPSRRSPSIDVELGLQLKLGYSIHHDLSVRSNGERSWDYTTPSTGRQPGAPMSLAPPPGFGPGPQGGYGGPRPQGGPMGGPGGPRPQPRWNEIPNCDCTGGRLGKSCCQSQGAQLCCLCFRWSAVAAGIQSAWKGAVSAPRPACGLRSW